jgi:hypothetical protein
LLDKRVVIVEPLHAAMMCNGNEKAHDRAGSRAHAALAG